MEQVFLRTHKTKYNKNSYAEWSQLPPNLPLPSTQTISALYLTFTKVLYLQQLGEQQPLQLKLQWWGMGQPHNIIFNHTSQKSIIAKYIICCPTEGLLSYFQDTKLLAIDVSIKNKIIGKSYLNFLVLKGWRGQKYEGYMDIKQGRKKIGEVNYLIQIVKANNPYLNIQNKQPKVDVQATNKRGSVNPNNQKNQQKIDINYLNPNAKAESDFQENASGEMISLEQNKLPRHNNNVSINSEKPHLSIPNNNNAIERRQGVNKFYTPKDNYPELGINTRNSFGNYQTEMIRLIQDYNLLFQKNQAPIIFEQKAQNIIEIQIIKLDLSYKQQNPQIEVILPITDGLKNLYKLGPGSFVKIFISQQLSKNQLINYLKNCVIQFKTPKCQGSIKLSKILARNNQIIQIPLFQKDKQSKKQKQKGTCFIKAIPPQNIVQKFATNNQGLQNRQISRKQQQIKQQTIQQQYVLLSVKQYNSVEPFQRKINCFVKISQKQSLKYLAETKTLWNAADKFIFQDKVTCKIGSNALNIQIFDRQKTEVKLGQGLLVMDAPIGINIQIPIHSRRINKPIVIGYLSIDFVKNGLNSVTKMIDMLGTSKNILIPSQNLSNNNKKHNNNQNIQQQKHQQVHQDIHHQQQKKFQHQIEQQKKQIQLLQNLQYNLPQKHFIERNLNELQIYNKIFTYLYQNNHLIQPINELSQLKITQFLHLFQQVQIKKVLNMKQLNLLISKHLFSTHQKNHTNKINITQFRDSYDAFCTYYQQLIDQRDTVLKQFLEILDNVGININDLERQLKNNKKIWEKLNQFLSFGKGEHINIIQDIRQHYQSPDNTKNIQYRKQFTGTEFCDILRRFQVYETTLGQQIYYKKISEHIYQNICRLLLQIQPYIKEFTYRQLILLLEEQQIILSQWQMANLEDHMNGKIYKPRPNKYNLSHNKDHNLYPERKEKQTRQKIYQQIKQNDSQLDNKPTITKSPTFGYLHAPQLMMRQGMTSSNDMADSLAIKMNNLPISPINYNSSKQGTQQLRAALANLKYKPLSITIDGQLINLNLTNNYYSKKSNENIQINRTSNYNSNKVPMESGQIEQNRTIKSIDQPSKKQYNSKQSSKQNKNIELSLQNVNKKFNYQMQIVFQEQPYPIGVQCLHQQWTALVNEQGDYLGGIVIY